MQIQSIKINEAYPSPTNPRGAVDDKSPAFKDLVASIKEKGVLVPVIARQGKGSVEKAMKYEIVAGNRRLAAAKAAGLKEIPAQIREMSDAEAREVQIIENLQREDVHPLEEAQAYRELVEKSKYEIPSVAAKVGKSETYVRQRIFLTNLETAAANAYRSGRITDGHAVLIARLSPNDQAAALKFLTQSSYHTPSIAELKQYIDREFNSPLERQPWLKDTEALGAVGPCKECPPNVPSLFGAVKEGKCTDKKCWKRKMTKYINHLKAKNPKLVLISKEYRWHRDGEPAGEILYENDYSRPGPKDKCQNSVMGLVAQGRDVGSTIRICIAKECKVHQKKHSTGVPMTPAQKAKREKEAAAAKAKQERQEKKDREEMADALKKVKWPLTRQTLDVLLDIAIKDYNNDFEEIGPRRWPDAKPEKGESDIDWNAVVKRAAQKMTDAEKAQLLVETMLTSVFELDRKKFMKAL